MSIGSNRSMNGKIMRERVLHKVLDICVICVCMSVIDTVVLHKQIIVYTYPPSAPLLVGRNISFIESASL